MNNIDKLIFIGKNYLEHARELGDAVPDKPVIFLKPPSILKQLKTWQETEKLTILSPFSLIVRLLMSASIVLSNVKFSKIYLFFRTAINATTNITHEKMNRIKGICATFVKKDSTPNGMRAQNICFLSFW